jgi:hypothetical protein
MAPAGCGLFLLFVAFVGFLGWAVCRTVASLYFHHARARWWFLLGGTLLAGGGFGLWCAFYAEYRTSEDTRLLSAPIPAIMLKLEDGRWVDYVSPVSPFIAVLNWLTVFFGCAIPVSIGWRFTGLTGGMEHCVEPGGARTFRANDRGGTPSPESAA